MRELVIVISDLYLSPDRPAGLVPAQPEAFPGIERVARLGRLEALREGWRPWVARWLGLSEYADHAAASIAAAATPQVRSARACWLATPLHLIEGMSAIHLDRRGLLRLPREQRDRLAEDFGDTFHGSGFTLVGLESGEFLLTGAPLAPLATSEPARILRAGVAESLASGEGASTLRRLQSEIEMWLHAHPLNAERTHRGEPAVSTLWVWGGGEAPILSSAHRSSSDVVLGSEAYVHGLCRLAGTHAAPLPHEWPSGSASARRTLCVLHIAEVLQAHAHMSLTDAVGDLDRRVIAPAAAALSAGALERLVLLANDRVWALRRSDRWRWWRRAAAGLEALA